MPSVENGWEKKVSLDFGVSESEIMLASRAIVHSTTVVEPQYQTIRQCYN